MVRVIRQQNVIAVVPPQTLCRSAQSNAMGWRSRERLTMEYTPRRFVCVPVAHTQCYLSIVSVWKLFFLFTPMFFFPTVTLIVVWRMYTVENAGLLHTHTHTHTPLVLLGRLHIPSLSVPWTERLWVGRSVGCKNRCYMQMLPTARRVKSETIFPGTNNNWCV